MCKPAGRPLPHAQPGPPLPFYTRAPAGQSLKQPQPSTASLQGEATPRGGDADGQQGPSTTPSAEPSQQQPPHQPETHHVQQEDRSTAMTPQAEETPGPSSRVRCGIPAQLRTVMQDCAAVSVPQSSHIFYIAVSSALERVLVRETFNCPEQCWEVLVRGNQRPCGGAEPWPQDAHSLHSLTCTTK